MEGGRELKPRANRLLRPREPLQAEANSKEISAEAAILIAELVAIIDGAKRDPERLTIRILPAYSKIHGPAEGAERLGELVMIGQEMRTVLGKFLDLLVRDDPDQQRGLHRLPERPSPTT